MTTLEDIASKLEDITSRLDTFALHLAGIQNSSEVLQRDVRILRDELQVNSAMVQRAVRLRQSLRSING
jgi:hypothetical protein